MKVAATITEMKTAVVILNWNTRHYLERFLPSLIDSCEGEDAEVIVADNGSSDGSVEYVSERFPGTKLISLDRNYGFTGGYNRVLSELDYEYYVLINSDIEVKSDWLHILTEWMDNHPDCGICGPKILSFDKRDTFEYAGAAGGYLDPLGFPYCRGRVMGKLEKDHGQYDTVENVLWVSGACLMIRSGLWRKLGGLDERFFAHMEELDLCWRAQIAGYKVQCIPQAAIYHIGGGSLENGSPFKLKLNYRNNLMLLENNLPSTVGKAKASIILSFRMFLDNCARMIYFLQGRKDYAASVKDAHREFREMRRGINGSKIKGTMVYGLNKGLIFVRYLKTRV